jgi:hypothetical protein
MWMNEDTDWAKLGYDSEAEDVDIIIAKVTSL